MKVSGIKSCYIGPEVSPEQFIAEHFFLFLVKGTINAYDGNRHYLLQSGESCIVRKNRLARYNKLKENDEFEKVVFIFDEAFLKSFQKKHSIPVSPYKPGDAFIRPKKDKAVENVLLSLATAPGKPGKMSNAYSDLKRGELLQVLLQLHPGLAAVLFDFGKPGRMDLEAFMQRNYKFNVSMERFAFLTGRSISAFKRDFKQIFQETPNRWLVKRRLQEARFLIEKKSKKSSDIYLDLGFEDLSHFSFAFKKYFGLAPSQLA